MVSDGDVTAQEAVNSTFIWDPGEQHTGAGVQASDGGVGVQRRGGREQGSASIVGGSSLTLLFPCFIAT